MRKGTLVVAGLVVVLLGFTLIVVGSLDQGSVSTGVFILIGPFPIVFGSGSNGGILALLSLMVGLLMVFLIYVGWKEGRVRGTQARSPDNNT